MNRIFTKEDIREILEGFGKKTGVSPKDIPIKISSRMEKTFGAFQFKLKDGKVEPIAFKFSLKLLSGDFDEETVIGTIGHEYVHFYVNVRDNVNHNHDAVFKKTAESLGVPQDTYFTAPFERKEKAGYIITCSECGKETARRRRKDVALKIRRHYRSGCCHAKMDIRKTVF